MLSLIIFLQAHAQDILQAVADIVAGASLFANFTPTDKDNKAVGFLSTAVHFLAANFFTLSAPPSTYNR